MEVSGTTRSRNHHSFPDSQQRDYAVELQCCPRPNPKQLDSHQTVSISTWAKFKATANQILRSPSTYNSTHHTPGHDKWLLSGWICEGRKKRKCSNVPVVGQIPFPGKWLQFTQHTPPPILTTRRGRGKVICVNWRFCTMKQRAFAGPSPTKDGQKPHLYITSYTSWKSTIQMRTKNE